MATRETAHDIDTSTAASRPSHPNDVVWRSGSRAVHGRRLRLVAALVSAIVASTAGLWSTSHIAAADVGTWCNNDPITVPDSGAASPYPSTVTVSDAGTFAGTVTVELTGVSHSYPGDLDILLVSPTGHSLVLMSDASDQYTNAAATTLTFADSAAGPIPFDSILTSGTYLPTNGVATTDAWPAPAPPPSDATTLAAFVNNDPNGDWNLFVVDGARNDAGSVGGWCLTITTADGPFAASATSVVSSPNPSLPGDAVMFTATVTGGANPATSGTVTFREGSTTLAADLPVNGLGQASFATDALSVGAHAITAHFSGNLEVLISTGSVTHNVTVLPAGRWCSDDPLVVPDVGAATPYPSTIIVSGAGIDTAQVTVHLLNVSHSFLRDLDVLLVGPTGEDLVLMSDVGRDRTTDATLTFSDVASGPILFDDRVATGTYLPTNFAFGSDAWPAPAPATLSGATRLATFDGGDPNGIWSLFVTDDLAQDAGSIASWCLDISTAISPTVTALASAPNPSTFGEPVALTATVTSKGEAVTTGTVTFTDDTTATTLATDVPIDAQGQATLDTTTLTVGDHQITATYSGTDDLMASDGTLTQTVNDADTATALSPTPNPSTFGQPVGLTATVTSGAGPVTGGTVTFTDDTTATTLAADVPVDAQGQATAHTSTLAVGSHQISAIYSGATGYVSSVSAPMTQVVDGVAHAGGPVSIDEGDDLTLDASASIAGPTATFSWDVNGDGTFGDTTGVNPTLSWIELQTLGISNGTGTSTTVTVQINDGPAVLTAATTLTIDNVAPTATIDAPATATAGHPVTIKVGAVDPSRADMTGAFAYTVDWGDRTTPDTLTGPADAPVTHTFTTPGIYTITATTTDPDGATSQTLIVQITVAPAPTPTTTAATPLAAAVADAPTADPEDTTPIEATLPTTGGDARAVVRLGLALVGAGLVIVAASHRRRAATTR